MSSIFRETPSNFYYLVLSCEEEESEQDLSPPPSKKCSSETNQDQMPKNLHEFIKTLLSSTNCEYSIRKHSVGSEDVCSEFVQPHFHLLFYIKSFVGAETYLQNILLMVFENSKRIKNCNIKLQSISYPEICLEKELSNSSNTLTIHGDKLKAMLTCKPTFDLGCHYKVIWQFKRECYSPFSDTEDPDKVSYLCKKLVALQNSDAVFKDSVVDYIDLLLRGFGTMQASHHNNTLKVNLAFSDAQCPCFECMEGENPNMVLLNQRDLNYHNN